MRKFGLIGFPLGHSFSEKYFAEKFEREKIPDCRYDNYPIESLNMLPDLISNEKDLCGLNVTIPYKTEILKYLDYVDPEIREIGSVNVVKIKKVDGRPSLYGFNSDIKGISDSIIPVLDSGIKNVLILGSGGSSNAVRYTMRKLGLSVTVVSRTKTENNITYDQVSRDLMINTDIIINTTPLGMFPDVTGLPPLNYNFLKSDHILFDLVYNPEITAFLRKGEEKGCRIITGLKMLYSQAERSWDIWNDEDL